MTYQDAESWVSVFEAATADEAGIVKGMLGASKIPVMLDSETANSAADFAEFDVVVKVPKDKAARAAQLLQATPYGVPE